MQSEDPGAFQALSWQARILQGMLSEEEAEQVLIGPIPDRSDPDDLLHDPILTSGLLMNMVIFL